MNKEWFSTGKLSAAAEIQHILNLVASQYGGGGGVTKHIKLRGGSAYNQQIRDSCKKEKSHTYIYIYIMMLVVFASHVLRALFLHMQLNDILTHTALRSAGHRCRTRRKLAAGQTLDWCSNWKNISRGSNPWPVFTQVSSYLTESLIIPWIVPTSYICS